jgi:hypothetical protein
MAILAAVTLPAVLTAVAVAYWPARRVAQGMAILVTSLALGLLLGFVIWGFAVSPAIDAHPYEATWGQRLVPCESRRGLDALFPVLHGSEGSPIIGSGCSAVVPTAVGSTAILAAIALPGAVACTAIWRWSRQQMSKDDDGPISRPRPRTSSTS